LSTIDAFGFAEGLDHESERAGARGRGIEHAHVDVVVRRERGERTIAAARVHVVDEQAHPDATVGRLEQRESKVAARQVGVPDVRLHVDAAASRLRGQRPDGERLGALAEQTEARVPWMERLGVSEGRVEPRPGSGGESLLHRQFRTRTERHAASQDAGDPDQRQSVHVPHR
jgi:hypothetical protein